MKVFHARGRYVMALTYGAGADWVKNVLAAGGCALETRGQRVQLTAPRLFHDKSRRDVRAAERQILRLVGVADFLELVPDTERATHD